MSSDNHQFPIPLLTLHYPLASPLSTCSSLKNHVTKESQFYHIVFITIQIIQSSYHWILKIKLFFPFLFDLFSFLGLSDGLEVDCELTEIEL
jgi:hypothetical protein